MRTLFGVVLGALITVGAAYFHDNNVAPNPTDPRLTDRQIVNWDVFGAVLRQTTDGIGNAWHSLTGK
ncbi:MAG TPA: hypothetical protein VHA70_02755 [Bauldia sp.]|nr:hypothetical protein [Bauldia sp.]